MALRPLSCSRIAIAARLSLVTLAVAVLLPQSIFAQTNRRNVPDTTTRTYLVRGSVRSAVDDQPIQMVRVDLVRFTGETVGTMFTRSNGDFEFTGLRSGEYIIDVKHEGFEPVRERVDIMNSSRVGVFVFLKALPSSRPGVSGPPVSARELSLPRRATEAFNKGLQQLGKSSPEASLKHFDKALDEHDAYYEAHHMRAVAYFQLGKLAEAEKDFRASIEKSNNKYAEPFFGLAALDINAKKFTEALQFAEQGLGIDQDSWRGYFELARAQMGLNQLDAAAKSIAEARQRKQDYPDLYLVSANINMRRQNAPALLDDLDHFLKLQPEGPMADQARKMSADIRQRMAAAQAQKPQP